MNWSTNAHVKMWIPNYQICTCTWVGAFAQNGILGLFVNCPIWLHVYLDGGCRGVATIETGGVLTPHFKI